MIETLLTILASIPIIAIGLLVYFMVFWSDATSWKDALFTHVAVLIMAWFVWSLFWFSGGKESYQAKHQQNMELR